MDSTSTSNLFPMPIDTHLLTRQVRNYLKVNQINWSRFARLVLGVGQARLSALLSSPRPWALLSIRIRSLYNRLQEWMDTRATYGNNPYYQPIKTRLSHGRGRGRGRKTSQKPAHSTKAIRTLFDLDEIISVKEEEQAIEYIVGLNDMSPITSEQLAEDFIEEIGQDSKENEMEDVARRTVDYQDDSSSMRQVENNNAACHLGQTTAWQPDQLNETINLDHPSSLAPPNQADMESFCHSLTLVGQQNLGDVYHSLPLSNQQNLVNVSQSHVMSDIVNQLASVTSTHHSVRQADVLNTSGLSPLQAAQFSDNRSAISYYQGNAIQYAQLPDQRVDYYSASTASPSFLQYSMFEPRVDAVSYAESAVMASSAIFGDSAYDNLMLETTRLNVTENASTEIIYRNELNASGENLLHPWGANASGMHYKMPNHNDSTGSEISVEEVKLENVSSTPNWLVPNRDATSSDIQDILSIAAATCCDNNSFI